MFCSMRLAIEPLVARLKHSLSNESETTLATETRMPFEPSPSTAKVSFAEK